MLMFASGSALAENDCEFANDLDDNADCMVSEDEFFDAYDESGLYDTWDANDDGMLSEDEFGEGLFTFYDDNDDGYIDEGEMEVSDDPDEQGFWDW